MAYSVLKLLLPHSLRTFMRNLDSAYQERLKEIEVKNQQIEELQHTLQESENRFLKEIEVKNQQIEELQHTLQESRNCLLKEIDLKNQHIEKLHHTSQELQTCLEIIQNFQPLMNQNFPVFISDNYYPLAWHNKGQMLHKVFITSIPKSGTYLYSLLLKSMGVEQTNIHLSEIGFSDYRFITTKQAREDYLKLNVNIPLNESLKLISSGQFAVGHLPYSQNVVELLKDFKVIFVYRDLRDAVISHMHFFSNPGRGRGELDSVWKLHEDSPEKLLKFMKLYKEMFLNLYIPMIIG